jgi:DNA-binding response OmpR family regulator
VSWVCPGQTTFLTSQPEKGTFLQEGDKTRMARVVFVGVEQAAAVQIAKALAVERHQLEQKPKGAFAVDVIDADIVFAGGDPIHYLSLLRTVREQRPALPFVVVTRVPETNEWLDALEAGATDYCSAPFENRQINWLMESALPQQRPAAA